MQPLYELIRRRPLVFAAGVITVSLAITGTWWALSRRPPPNPALVSPILAVQAVSARSLYFNAAARPWLMAHRPELLTPDDRDGSSSRTREFLQAVQNPKLFRQIDRRYRFDTLLLVGDPSQFKPLLEHLLDTKDWTLTYLDHTSLIFKRDAASAWQPTRLTETRQHFSSGREQASFLAHAAMKLLAIRRSAEARAALDEAAKLDTGLPEVWNGLANYHMLRGEWGPALDHVNRALAADKAFVPALASKAQILYSTKKFGEAFELSKRLIGERPDDPALLFYHAKIAHEARAFRAEIETLERLILLAEATGWPASGYRIYLAQAFATVGEAQPAIDEFRRVLADPEISKEQRAFAAETLAQIRGRSGL